MTLRIELDIFQHFSNYNMTVVYSLQFAIKCVYRMYLMLYMIIMHLTIFEMMFYFCEYGLYCKIHLPLSHCDMVMVVAFTAADFDIINEKRHLMVKSLV